MIDTDLYTKLASLVNVPVQQNVIAETTGFDRVWYQRRGAATDVDLLGNQLLTNTEFDVECVSIDIDTAESLASTVKTALNGFFGLMGSTHVLGCFVEDQQDDYQTMSNDADTGEHVAAL